MGLWQALTIYVLYVAWLVQTARVLVLLLAGHAGGGGPGFRWPSPLRHLRRKVERDVTRRE